MFLYGKFGRQFRAPPQEKRHKNQRGGGAWFAGVVPWVAVGGFWGGFWGWGCVLGVCIGLGTCLTYLLSFAGHAGLFLVEALASLFLPFFFVELRS